MSNERILVVEDDHYSSEVTRHLFNYHQLTVDLVGSAEEALEFMSKQQYALVVIDLALPGMDGWALLRTVKANPPLSGIPCVAITAYHDTKLAHRALNEGFSAYFSKPLQTSFVAQLTNTILKH
jgi:CheY-like chemotaxis protein